MYHFALHLHHHSNYSLHVLLPDKLQGLSFCTLIIQQGLPLLGRLQGHFYSSFGLTAHTWKDPSCLLSCSNSGAWHPLSPVLPFWRLECVYIRAKCTYFLLAAEYIFSFTWELTLEKHALQLTHESFFQNRCIIPIFARSNLIVGYMSDFFSVYAPLWHLIHYFFEMSYWFISHKIILNHEKKNLP